MQLAVLILCGSIGFEDLCLLETWFCQRGLDLLAGGLRPPRTPTEYISSCSDFGRQFRKFWTAGFVGVAGSNSGGIISPEDLWPLELSAGILLGSP